jgi:2-polyprenyl-3-methyl-5-hydroxy-6-metoxy-1,4-benzoquinol methylase
MCCYLCGSDQYEEFARVDSFGYPLVYFQCDRCGLVFQSSETNQAVDAEFYAETYRQIYQASTEPTAKDLWVQENRALTLVSLLQTLKVQPQERILDIGASTGLLLETFRETFMTATDSETMHTSTGGEVVGVEPGDAYRAHAEARGLRMYPSVDHLIESYPHKFDLISMIHVLEHLPNPVGMLTQIRENLLQGHGILLLEVPNFYAHDSYELAHLACFTPHTLQQVLRQAGYHVFFFQRHGFPRSSMLNLYLTLLAQPLPADASLPAIKRDHMVRFKRQVGFLYRRAVEKLFPHKSWLPIPDVEE